MKERLEDQGGGDLVDYAAVGLTGVTGLIEDAVGFVAGEAFVPEVDGELGQLGKLRCECLDLGGLLGDLALRAERVADDNASHFVASTESGEGAEIFAWIAAPFECKDGLSGEA